MSEVNIAKTVASSAIKVLAEGNAQLVNAVRIANPSLSVMEAAEVANVVLVETSNHIANGEQIAFLKPGAEGKAQITVLGIEIHDEKFFGI